MARTLAATATTAGIRTLPSQPQSPSAAFSDNGSLVQAPDTTGKEGPRLPAGDEKGELTVTRPLRAAYVSVVSATATERLPLLGTRGAGDPPDRVESRTVARARDQSVCWEGPLTCIRAQSFDQKRVTLIGPWL